MYHSFEIFYIQLADDQYLLVVKSCCCLFFVTTSHPPNPQGDCPLALVVHAPTDTEGELDDSEDQQAK